MTIQSAFCVFCSIVSSALLSAAGLDLSNVSIGNRLQASTTFKLAAPAPEGGLEVTLTSEDPQKLKLALRPEDTGKASIVVNVQAGFVEGPDFWVQGFAGSGEVGYTAKAAGMPNARGVVTLTPSAIVMVGPFKANTFKTTTGGQLSRLVLYAARLTPDGKEYADQQAVAGGTSLAIDIKSSLPDVGSITPSSVSIPGGTPNAVADFKPLKAGSATLTTSIPPGMSPPPEKYVSVIAAVNLPGLGITGDLMIGQNLQIAGNVGLGEFAGPKGTLVTLTSNDETQLLISPSATEVGKKSIVLKIEPNGFRAPYFLQALGKTGTVSYTASAPGFASRQAKIGLAPSGLVIAPKAYGPPDEAELFKKPEGSRGFVTHLGKKSEKMGLAVWTAQLDPLTLRSADITVQPLRAGVDLKVELECSNPALGKVISPVIIKAGSESGLSEFTPLGEGTLIISTKTPQGFTKSANSSFVEAIVKK